MKAQTGNWSSCTHSLNSALDDGGWSTPHSGCVTLGNDPVPLIQEVGWAQAKWSGRARKMSPSPGFDLRSVQPVASRYTDWTIPALPILTEHFVANWKLLQKLQCYVCTFLALTHTHTHAHHAVKFRLAVHLSLHKFQICDLLVFDFRETGFLPKSVTEKRVLFASGWLSVFELRGDCGHVFKLCQQHNISTLVNYIYLWEFEEEFWIKYLKICWKIRF